MFLDQDNQSGSSQTMSRHVSTGTIKSRPSPFPAKSFTRFEPSHSDAVSAGHRQRANTVQSPLPSRKSQEEDRNDVFNKFDPESDTIQSPQLDKTHSFPDKFDELPVELASLTDRFVESLGAKVYEQPPDVDQLAELFQEFYIKASSSISIHISSLLSRLNREPAANTSKPSSKSKTQPGKGEDDTLAPSKAEGAQQMLTATEVTEKRKARKLLEYKRLVLEEAVEKRACEMVYEKIWRHKSTLDEVRDEKLRSKTAALALVGIGLKDLGIELSEEDGKGAEDVQELLLPARDGLIRMNDEKCPLGKLQHLTTAHKAIVDTLFSMHGSSSSADEILPTLIYTLITSPVEGINIISNLNFIDRFRTASKIDGEAAYCMTNLEAAISFLENVDLASLRSDELPEGPRKSPSRPSTPAIEKPEPFPNISTGTISTSHTTTASTNTLAVATSPAKSKSSSSLSRGLPSPRHQRTLSDLLQPLAATNEAMRNSAKEGIENISNTLDNSFKFLFGRLKEHAADPTSPKDVVLPKTLDEARLLVSRPPGPEDDSAAVSDTSSFTERDAPDSPAMEKTKSDDKLMSLFGGKKPVPVRERSVDSQKSSGSSRRVAFGQGAALTENIPQQKDLSVNTSATPLNSVKNIGSSLNPLSHIGNAFGGGFRGFGRPAMPTAAALPSPTIADSKKDRILGAPTREADKLEIDLESPAKVATKIRSVAPPIKKFVDASNAEDLKIKDVRELLEDYKRLARLLGQLANEPVASPEAPSS